MTVHYTKNNTPYLQSPNVSIISAPSFFGESADTFLRSFNEELGFDRGANDLEIWREEPWIDRCLDAESLCKFAGQLCYLSFGPNRTSSIEAEKYFDNIKSSGHGSVLEHANFSLLLWGVSRSLTHELVRHRAGFAFSQVSQRYVDGAKLRFVERPEYQADAKLHQDFEDRIDRVAKEYQDITENLLHNQKSGKLELQAESSTDRRKRIQQCSRSVLTNEVEAPIVVTANARAWRHFLNMRCSAHAETEIRILAYTIYNALIKTACILFDDFVESQLEDGTYILTTPFPKV